MKGSGGYSWGSAGGAGLVILDLDETHPQYQAIVIHEITHLLNRGLVGPDSETRIAARYGVTGKSIHHRMDKLDCGELFLRQIAPMLRSSLSLFVLIHLSVRGSADTYD